MAGEPIRVITPPAVEPLSISELAAHCRIDDDDLESQAELLGSYITAARLKVERDLRETLITTSLGRTFQSFPAGDWLPLSLGPVQQVNGVLYYDINNTQVTWSSTGYYTDLISKPARVIRKDGTPWPDTYNRQAAVYVIYTAGFGDEASDVPEDRRMLIRWLAAHMYERREPLLSGTIIAELPQHYEHWVKSIRDFRFS